ncbi:hypothetical protein EVAR_99240_1 [Eumeta japonica]|uniref:Uncharacterized protein n=1 Tax=Eumeta variegata TaxID=151549 RepID=A0A4C2AE79_EUMVA|nr:hypothetical protein EVAR_99240_1 [Eumeta japonica]
MEHLMEQRTQWCEQCRSLERTRYCEANILNKLNTPTSESTGQESRRLTSYYFIALGFTRCSSLLAGGQQPKQTHRCHTSHVYVVVYSTGQESRRFTSNYIIALGFTRCSFLLAGGQQPKQTRFCHTSHVHIVVYVRQQRGRIDSTGQELQIDKLLPLLLASRAVFLLAGGQQPKQITVVIHLTSTSSCM